VPCATTLYLDLETDAAIRRLWQGIEDAGLPSTMPTLGYRPHLSLAVCESMDMPALRDILPTLLGATPPIPLIFSNLSVFPKADGVVYLGVTASRGLMEFHEKVWQLMAAHTSGHSEYYSPGMWVPHITLDYGLTPEQVGSVITTVLKLPIPLTGIATELVVTDVSNNGYTDLYARKLGET
jgi:hypothetical protein